MQREAQIGLFSFTRFMMWRDLDAFSDLMQNAVVSHLVERPSAAYDTAPQPRAERLDDDHGPEDLLCPREADSTQLSTVVAASEGRDFVLEGPPGTGKSQTITNLIAHCLATGRRVFFIRRLGEERAGGPRWPLGSCGTGGRGPSTRS